jgi:hypothetical protein
VIPENLQRPSGKWSGDTETTAITNARVGERSWPCETVAGGDLVFITEIRRGQDGVRLFVSTEGDTYTQDAHGRLIKED